MKLFKHKTTNYTGLIHFQVAKRLLVRAYTVALPVRVPEHVILTRLIMGGGVRVTEVVTRVDRLNIHL